MQLYDYQTKLANDIRMEFANGAQSVLGVLPTGGGKCLAKGTKVLMYDGSTKNVEDIETGELLIGPDSKPRKVLSVCTGHETMYEITPIKGDAYTVNESHILSLRITNGSKGITFLGKRVNDGDIVNTSITDYLSASKTFKHVAKGWRTGVDFSPNVFPLPIAPYFFGLWLGDGNSRGPSVCSGDLEVEAYLYEYAEQSRCRIRKEFNSENSFNYHFADTVFKGNSGAKFINAFKSLGVYKNKHIPVAYKRASREERLQLLAGFIDADGSYDGKSFDVSLKSERLMDDVIFISRSLGFSAYKAGCKKTCTNNGKIGDYFRCSISGDIDQVPCKIKRKQAKPRGQVKNVLNVGITVKKIGVGEYYGFEIDRDHLFLLGDFTVTHNTVVGASIMKSTLDKPNKTGKPKRAWVLAHRVELIRQFHTAFKNFGINAGLVNPAFTPNYRAAAQVGSIQTIVKRLDVFTGDLAPDLIMIDEAHHATSSTYRKILAQYPDAYIIGLTATPIRGDGKGLGVESGGVFQSMVQGPQIQDLINMGRLVKPILFYPPGAVNMDGIDIVRGDYDKEQALARVDKPSITGDAITHYRKYCDGEPGVVFCINVAHAEHVAAQFRAAGYRAWSVDGSMDDATRRGILDGLGNGSVQIVTSCDLISEGTDIPRIACAFLLRPTKSTGLYLQQVGRALRVVPGKDRAYIFDHVNNWFEHGLPEAHRDWSLEGETKKKKKKGETKLAAVRYCPMCYIVSPSHLRICPACGHIHLPPQGRKIDEVEGELVEMTEAQKTAMKWERIKKVNDAKTFEELKALGEGMGYKPGWAKHIWKSRQDKEAAKKKNISGQSLPFPK